MRAKSDWMEAKALRKMENWSGRMVVLETSSGRHEYAQESCVPGKRRLYKVGGVREAHSSAVCRESDGEVMTVGEEGGGEETQVRGPGRDTRRERVEQVEKRAEKAGRGGPGGGAGRDCSRTKQVTLKARLSMPTAERVDGLMRHAATSAMVWDGKQGDSECHSSAINQCPSRAVPKCKRSLFFGPQHKETCTKGHCNDRYA